MRVSILVTAAVLFIVNICVQAQASPIRSHERHHQLQNSWIGHYDKAKGEYSDVTVSNGEHLGLINGTIPGPARTAGDTQSN
jgi:hypothetical protein